MKKVLIVAALLIPAAVIAGLYAYVIYHAPRMKEQQHIRAFQTLAPLPPKGTVTVEVPVSRVPKSAITLRNPLPATPDNIRWGRVYYAYYCQFCHGEKGGGNGPVGESYVPTPADLRTERVRGYGDGQLLKSMLTGVGHEPVLEQVVPLRHRWYLALYVRSLGTGTPSRSIRP